MSHKTGFTGKEKRTAYAVKQLVWWTCEARPPCFQNPVDTFHESTLRTFLIPLRKMMEEVWKLTRWVIC
jgi:hypothetical protein